MRAKIQTTTSLALHNYHGLCRRQPHSWTPESGEGSPLRVGVRWRPPCWNAGKALYKAFTDAVMDFDTLQDIAFEQVLPGCSRSTSSKIAAAL